MPAPAGSRDPRLQHLYASIPEDTGTFSPIELLSAAPPRELTSSTDRPRITVHAKNTLCDAESGSIELFMRHNTTYEDN
ncbi:hypothetical protein VZT92_020681 [Zoarces viviparus]|uniref:Uncharacterized protein n=1 Tax=Zoarces viviparus TaxID=48416 RepID=A0AAW1EDT6_ZOAVI